MNGKLKDALGVVAAIVVIVIGYAAWSTASSYGKSIQPSSFRSFSVTGNGTATSTPNVAEFSFQVVTEGGTDLGTTQSQNTDAVNKAIAYVKSQGVSDADIKTEYYNIDPRYQTYNCNQPVPYNGVGNQVVPVQPCPPSTIVGYTVTQSVDVKVREFSKIGDIMSGIVSNGANQVGALSFTVDDPTKVEDAARADAISKAKAQAEAIAQAGGFKLGRLLGIQEGGNYYPMTTNAGAGTAMAYPSAAAAPAIQPGSQETDISMTLQYEIE